MRTFQGPLGPLWRFHLILFNYLKSRESFRLPKSVLVVWVWPRAVSICDITWPSIWIIPNVECNNRSWLPNFFQVSPCQALPPKLHVSQSVKVFFFLCLCWNYILLNTNVKQFCRWFFLNFPEWCRHLSESIRKPKPPFHFSRRKEGRILYKECG